VSAPGEEQHARYVDVTIVEFAAHTAYFDPLTGVGYLVTPRPDDDVDAPIDPLVEAAWSERLADPGPTGHLTLHQADRERALSQLAELGWTLLYDEDGAIETAGRTLDGCEVQCVYADPAIPDPTFEAIDCAVIALDIAAQLDLDA
jgi:hypothetical protein